MIDCDLYLCAGSDYWVKDYTGSYAFDYIADHREWMDSGFFPEDVRARLKGGFMADVRRIQTSISVVISMFPIPAVSSED